jgi:hypothetical protein
MARFLRQVPDQDRPKDEAPFSTADQNAKTDVLERLLDPIAPDATTGTGGFQQRKQTIPGQIVAVRLAGIDELGGGKYWGWVIPLSSIKWGWDLTYDLDKDHLGDWDPGINVQVWYPPEMGTSDHNLKYSSDVDASADDWDFITGVVTVESGYGKPIVIAFTSKGVAPVLVETISVTFFAPFQANVKSILPSTGEVDPGCMRILVQLAQRHSMGDRFYVIQASKRNYLD